MTVYQAPFRLADVASLAYDLSQCGCALPLFAVVQYPTGLLSCVGGE